uniref:Cytochrome b n=1 Tax=Neofoleyellides sp. XM-2022 TaxID=3014012 RepID=A0A9E9FY73_9BILA|nr:cytochrome b [Neofoleyellides sp. XM-2022]
MSVFFNSLVFLPTSFSLSYLWNIGSMLGMVLFFQILSGFFLTFYYSTFDAFASVQYIMYEVNFGWLVRILHSNGASLFFFFIYLHIFKGLINFSYRLVGVWISGILIYFLLMGIAFTGYVLIWGQMSYWAAVVITSLASSLPYFGKYMVWWIWGGFGVCSNTLKFFYSFHFIMPWLVFLVVFFHLFFLHYFGSSSSLFCHGDYDKVCFYPVYWIKDSLNVFFLMFFFIFIVLFSFVLCDPMIFLECDVMVSPLHVVPEWYFLFAFTILRSIPDKLLGVVFMFLSVFSLLLLIFPKYYGSMMDNILFFFVMCFIWVFFWLTWAGFYPVDYPFDYFNFLISFLYFFMLLLMVFLNFLSKKLFF